MLVGLMILVSNYPQRFANLLGSNTVLILTTLILLAYACKGPPHIDHCSLYHLPWISSKLKQKGVAAWCKHWLSQWHTHMHSTVCCCSACLSLFFLPYTLLLHFGQCLLTIIMSHLKLFSWVNSARLKPFMDSYHVPYKAKHCYWPGLLLVFCLFFF